MNRNCSISIKTEAELQILREAGNILASIVRDLKCSLKSGMSTQDIDIIAENLIRDYHVEPAFKGYRGFPGCICASVNEEVVHGIPSSKIVNNGDIISIDVGVIYQGYFSDMAITIGIGDINIELQRLLEVTYNSLLEGIEHARVGNHLSDISHAVQMVAEKSKFSVVRDFVGHGIGKNLHEDPEIPNFGEPHLGPVLKEGMVFAIEPMVNLGKYQTKILDDGWTVVTQDGKPSAHFEHTVAITKNGPEILTL